MLRIPLNPRENWRDLANDYGFEFHTMHGEAYWDESAYYQFSLEQIERDLEQPTEEIHQMCLEVVDKVIRDEYWLKKFCIAQPYWDFILESWQRGDPSLYSRLDFTYDGKSPAKLYENNADTPTSLYETGFWQWLWLKDGVDQGRLSRRSDQFNSLQEKLVNRFKDLAFLTPNRTLHFACCKDTPEDRGTVTYLEDCAKEAGIEVKFVFIEDIGRDAQGRFSDSENQVISWMFKLYPWEFMFEEEFGALLPQQNMRWLEPPWKSLISNKALLPMLWSMFPNHPNLLPAFFENEKSKLDPKLTWVKKPIFSREGANITISAPGASLARSDGPYGDEGYIYQAFHALPRFANNHTLVGSWLVDDQAAGISIREDNSMITQDMSRYLPHIIL